MTHDREDQDQPALWGNRIGPGRQQERRSAPDVPATSGRAVHRTPPLLPTKRPVTPVEHRDLWDIDDVANYLGVPKQTVYSWRTTGYGPHGFRVGKHLRWRSATVIAWTLGLEQDQGAK